MKSLPRKRTERTGWDVRVWVRCWSTWIAPCAGKRCRCADRWWAFRHRPRPGWSRPWQNCPPTRRWPLNCWPASCCWVGWAPSSTSSASGYRWIRFLSILLSKRRQSNNGILPSIYRQWLIPAGIVAVTHPHNFDQIFVRRVPCHLIDFWSNSIHRIPVSADWRQYLAGCDCWVRVWNFSYLSAENYLPPALRTHLVEKCKTKFNQEF